MQIEIKSQKEFFFRLFCMVLLFVLAGQMLHGITENMPVFAKEDASVQDRGQDFDPIGNSEGFSAVLYNNMSGLPTSEANAIAETSEGFIWIGSYSGLIRYDGHTFERMDSTNGIASVVSLYVDSKNRLWIGTTDSGVAVMEQGEVRMYNKKDGLKSAYVHAIVEDENGDIYIGTTHGMAMIDEKQELHSINEPQINEEYILTLKIGIDGIIYGVTMDGAIFTMKDGHLTGYYDGAKLDIEGIRYLLPDPEHAGYVYVGAKNSDLYYGELTNSLEGAKKLDISPLSYVNSIAYAKDYIWVCADNGCGIVDGDQIRTLDNVPVTTSYEEVMTDYQGNLWFVSSKQGVMKVVPNQFTDMFARYGLDDMVVNTTCMYDGRLFIGTKSDGLIVAGENGVEESVPLKTAISASGEKIEETDLLRMLDKSRIRSIIRDSKNRLWISTYGETGLIRYDGENVVRFNTEDGLPSERVRAIYERQDGLFMVACTGGLVLIEDDKVSEIYDESAGITNTEVLTAIEAENQDMLIGTDGDGIYVINDSKVVHLGTDAGLASEVVMRIKKDPMENIYWIVTSNSIAYMDADYHITTIKKFPFSNNFDVYENSKGEVWVLSSNGIYVVSREELLENGNISPVYYGRANGLPCITTGNSYSELTEDGDLYISGTTGVAKVNIENPFDSVENIKMAVPFVEADGKFVYPDESGKITIPSSVKKLSIYSYVYTYSLMDPQVTYYLDGFEQEKITIKRSELAPLDYTNLKGGEYHFVMQLKDAMGYGNKEMSVTIVKEKGIREQLWFQILQVVLLILLIAAVVQIYFYRKTQKLKKKEQENRTLIREITEAFAMTVDMKDAYTNGHSNRVATYTSMLARELGYDEDTVEKYYNIALLHDIGKIGVPAEVLNKPGKLTDEEFAIIKSHASQGYEALKKISIMPELATGAGAHHERPDGKGYPKGLKGDEIPRVAQIIAVADTFDAMYSNRPYRKRMNFEKVVSIIQEVSGTQLTDDVVEAFMRLVEKGEFRDPDDDGGGTMDDIDNIRKRYEKEQDKEKEKE